jgi:hypothetical protein
MPLPRHPPAPAPAPAPPTPRHGGRYRADTNASTPTPVYFRTYAQIAQFFDGFDLVDPGLVILDRWHPDPSDPPPTVTRWMYGGVGRLP